MNPLEALRQEGRVLVVNRDGRQLGSLPRPDGPPTVCRMAVHDPGPMRAGDDVPRPRILEFDLVTINVAHGWENVLCLSTGASIADLRLLRGWRDAPKEIA